MVPLKFPKTLKPWEKMFLRTPDSESLDFAQKAMTATNIKKSVQAASFPCSSPFQPHSNCVGQLHVLVPITPPTHTRNWDSTSPVTPTSSSRKVQNRDSRHLSSHFQCRLALERLWKPFCIRRSSSSSDRAILPAPGPQPLQNISQNKDSTEWDLGSPNSG